MKKPDLEKLRPLIEMSVEEDLGSGDVTSELFFEPEVQAKTKIVPREDVTVCGMDVAREVLGFYSEDLELEVQIEDGQRAKAG
jgi:nicotinate-nucleotide pyrophosphorylase (carboxylating)